MITYCNCGNEIDGAGSLCARCAALQILGLEAGATKEEIRSSYHLLIKVWHPDRFQGDSQTRAQAEEKLKGINEAYRLLRTGPAAGQPRKASSPRPAPSPEPRRGNQRDVSQSPRRSYWGVLLRKAILPVGAIAGLAIVGWFLFNPVDDFLANNPVTSSEYLAARSRIAGMLAQIRLKAAFTGRDLRHLLAGGSAPLPDAVPEPVQKAAAEEPRSGRRQPGAASAQPVRLLPYITAGLTEPEVIAVQGPPDSASDDKLVYGKSEFTFTHGQLTGWKIDPASTQIRVKLWPNAPVDPDQESFTVGSSKNEVLAVQGTPSRYSENVFGYGNSEVYFKNGRVVSWKNAPGPAPLRGVVR